MTKSFTAKMVVGGAAAFAVAAASVTIAVAGNTKHVQRAETRGGHSALPYAKSVPHAVAANYKLFRDARAASAQDSVQFTAWVDRMQLNNLPIGLNLELARYIDSPEGLIGIIPANGGNWMCVIVVGGGMTCPLASDFATSGGWIVYHTATDPKGTVHVLGVAADNIASVSATADGTTTTIPVVNNVYSTTLSVRTPDSVKSIAFNATSGQVTTQSVQGGAQ